MKKLILFLILSSTAWASKTTLTGTITDGQGNLLNGTLIMQLPVPAQDTTTNTAVTPSPVYFRLVNGAITGGAQLYDVTNLQPQGLYYIASAYDSAGNKVMGGAYYVTGATFNLGAATPTSIVTANVAYANLCLIAPGTCPGTINAKSYNGIQMADQFAGATADVKIAACIAALPSAGGTCDARGFGATTQSIAATVNVASTSGHVHLQLDRATVFQPSTAALNMFTIGQNGSIDGLTVQVNGVTYTGTVVQMLGGADGQRTTLSNYLICNGTVTTNGPCHGTDTQLGTGTAVSFNGVNGVNASFFNSVLHGKTVGFQDAYLFTANGGSGTFYSSNSNVLDDFGAKNAKNCVHFNSNPGDVLGNQVSNGECEAATSGVGNVANCILTDGAGTNLSGNFLHAVNCWDYPATTTEVNFSGTTATRNWFVIQDRNLGATPVTDNSTTKTNVVLNIGQNGAGNDFPIFRGTGDMEYVTTANGHGIKLIGPDTQWNFQTHINATGDLCLTLAGVAVEWCMAHAVIFPQTDGLTALGKSTNGFNSLFLFETTAPSASANHDNCYADSTAHALKCSYNNGTFFQVPQVITATSTAFATATTAGTCVQNVTAVTGATTSMAVAISPVSTPGVGAQWSAFVSSSGNVTINECAVAASAGGTIAFNIRVFP